VELGSVLLTRKLPFSIWEGIFKDPMTTAAAIAFHAKIATEPWLVASLKKLPTQCGKALRRERGNEATD
jgi:hypothetical protein